MKGGMPKDFENLIQTAAKMKGEEMKKKKKI